MDSLTIAYGTRVNCVKVFNVQGVLEFYCFYLPLCNYCSWKKKLSNKLNSMFTFEKAASLQIQ